MMKKTDSLQRFIFDNEPIRGEIARLNSTYQTIIRQRPYPPVVRQFLGEALVSCLLLTGSIKFEGLVSLQFEGDARLPLLLAQCDHQLNMRAFAKYEDNDTTADYQDAFLEGRMTLMIKQDQQTQSYQSIVPLRSLSMAENLTYYFAQSEQLSSRIWLSVNDVEAAGMLLQLMPGQTSDQREEFWKYAVTLGETVTDEELLTLDNETLLHRLYHEKDCRLFDKRPVQFKCSCHPDKMKDVLRVLGEADIKQLLDEKGYVEVTCDFCLQHYAFDKVDLALLFHQHPQAPSDLKTKQIDPKLPTKPGS